MIESDKDLLSRYVMNRDQESFERIVRRHSGMVLGVCLNVLGNRQDAEDAFQVIFMVLSDKASKLLSHCSIGGWLHETSLRTCLSMRRKLRQKREVPVDLIQELETSQHWQRIAKQEKAQGVHQEIAGLPSNYRNVIVLCHLEGKTRSQAAAILNTTTASVKSILVRARRMLRIRLLRQGIATTALVATASGVKTCCAAPGGLVAESLIQSTLQACGLGSSVSGVGLGSSIWATTGRLASMSKIATSAIALSAIFVSVGLGAVICLANHDFADRVVVIDNLDSSPVPVSTVQLELESQDQDQDEQDPEEAGNRPNLIPPVVVPGVRLAPGARDPFLDDEAVAGYAKARFGRVIADISQTVNLSEGQLSRLKVAAKGATKKASDAHVAARERLEAIRGGEADAEMTQAERQAEFSRLLNQLMMPGSFEKGEFWQKEIRKILTESQYEEYSTQVEMRQRRIMNARISAFVARVDEQLLLAPSLIKNLTRFIEERYAGNRPRVLPFRDQLLDEKDQQALKVLLGESVMNSWTEGLSVQLSELIYR